MAAISFSHVRFYSGGWSSWGTSVNANGYYCNNGSKNYHCQIKVSVTGPLGGFKLSTKIMPAQESASSATWYAYIYSSEPDIANIPSGYLGYASTTGTPTTTITFTFSGLNLSTGTYYIHFRSDVSKYFTLGGGGFSFSSVTGSKVKVTLSPSPGSGGTTAIWFYNGVNTIYSNEACTTTITKITVPSRTGYAFTQYNGSGSHGGNAGERYIYSDGTFATDLGLDITSNDTFTAVWTANQYDVRYSVNGGTWNSSDSRPGTAVSGQTYVMLTYDSSVIQLYTPSKTGYNFAGWAITNCNTSTAKYRTSASGSWAAASNTTYNYNYLGLKNLKPSSSGSSVGITAQWSEKTATLTFSTTDGGTGHPAAITMKYTAATTIPSTLPTQSGYTCTGWSTTLARARNGNRDYATGATYKAANVIPTAATLYAIWQSSVTYNANGGSGAPGVGYMYYTPAFTLSATKPTRTGYTFANWNTNTSNTGTSYAASASLKGASAWKANTILYAIWTNNSYSISYTLNGGSQATANNTVKTFTIGSDPNVKRVVNPTSSRWDTWPNVSGANNIWMNIEKPTRTGYNFNGWTITGMDTNQHHAWGANPSEHLYSTKATEPNTSRFANDSTVYYNLRATSGTVNFAANWTAKTFTITLNQNGGAGGTTSVTIAYDTPKGSYPSITKPTRIGYTFNGYWSATSGGTQWYDANGNSLRTFNLTANTTWYARWTVNTTTFKLAPNGGTLAAQAGGSEDATTKNYTYNYGTTQTLPSPVKTGHTFRCWARNMSGSEVVNYGRAFMWTDYFQAAFFIYQADWSAVTTYAPGIGSAACSIVSCTESGGWSMGIATSSYKPFVQFYDSGASAYKTAYATDAITTWSAGWHLINVLYKNKIMYLYKDGTVIATTATGTNAISYHSVNSLFQAGEPNGTQGGIGNSNAYYKGYMSPIYINHQNTAHTGLVAGASAYNGSWTWVAQYYATANQLIKLNPNGGTVAPQAGGTASSSTQNYYYTYGANQTLPTPTRAGYTFITWGRQMNGTSEAINYGRLHMHSTAFRMRIRAYLDNWSTLGTKTIVSCTESGGWSLGNSDGKICFWCYSQADAAYKNALSTTTWASLAAGWHCFELTFDGTNAKGYVDGTLIATSAAFTTVSGKTTGAIGYNAQNDIFVGDEATGVRAGHSGSQYFNGMVGPLYMSANTTPVGTGSINAISMFASTSGWTFAAQWKVNTYTISYVLNGGTHGSSHPTSINYDTDIVISNPSRMGYTFAGWTISGIDGGQAKHGTAANPSITLSNNATGITSTYFRNLRTTSGTVTFTAVWTPITYTVQYNLDGGTQSHPSGYQSQNSTGTTTYIWNPTTCAYDMSNFTDTLGSSNGISSYWYAQAPTKNGYTFTGWIITNMSSDSNQFYYNSTDNHISSATVDTSTFPDHNLTTLNRYVRSSSGTVTYTAQYTPHTYTVEFKSGNSVLGTQSFTYGTAQNLKSYATLTAPSVPTSTYGWSFYGWATNYNTTTRNYADGASANNLTTTDDGTVTLYAIYTRNITFKYYNSASATSVTTDTSNIQYYRNSSTTAAGGTSVTVPALYTNSTYGWTPYGWIRNANTYTASSGFPTDGSSTSVTPSVTLSPLLYALYTRTVTLNYNANNGSGTTTATTGAQRRNANNAGAETITLTTATSTFTPPTGYAFDKWNTANDASGTDYAEGASYLWSNVSWTSVKTNTLYAIYKPHALVHFYQDSNSQWKPAFVYAWNSTNSEWELTMPYGYTSNEWKIGGPQ